MYKIIFIAHNTNGDNLKTEEYKKLVKKYEPKERRLRNFFISFITGGTIAFICELVVTILRTCFAFSMNLSYTLVGLSLVFIGSLLTGIGIFDDWVCKLKCGLIVPTTGFAHSVTSSALEYKRDGLITGLGSNFFKLAGSVILYGIISAFILVIVRVVLGV